MHYVLKGKILRSAIDLRDIVDRQFTPEHIQPANIAAE